MDSMTNYERLVSLVADLSALCIELAQRIEKLEEKSNYDGVYMEGTPEYVRDYVASKEGK